MSLALRDRQKMAPVVCITSHQEYSHPNAAAQARSPLELLVCTMKHALSGCRDEVILSVFINNGQIKCVAQWESPPASTKSTKSTKSKTIFS